MNYTTLEYQLRGSGAWVTFDRPEAYNAMSVEFIDELDRVIEEVKSDRRVRALVLTGRGSAFCAGADLKMALAFQGDGTSSMIDFLSRGLDVCRQLRDLPLPVIAAVNGWCMAGGLEMALVCDLIVAAESAVFSDAHARYGLLPALGGPQALTRAIGPFRAKEMLFTAGRYSASVMRDAGLVNTVVPDADLQSVVETLVTTLAQRSRVSIASLKQMVNTEFCMPWEQAARAELVRCSANMGNKDVVEGLSAFNEKRKPLFG